MCKGVIHLQRPGPHSAPLASHIDAPLPAAALHVPHSESFTHPSGRSRLLQRPPVKGDPEEEEEEEEEGGGGVSRCRTRAVLFGALCGYSSTISAHRHPRTRPSRAEPSRAGLLSSGGRQDQPLT